MSESSEEAKKIDAAYKPLCKKCGEPMSEHPCPKDIVKVLEAKFEPVEAEIEATDKMRELLRSIVADVEAMKCEMPNWYEALEDESRNHWFGGFAEGTYHPDPNEYPFFYIQWHNLGILLEKASELVNK